MEDENFFGEESDSDNDNKIKRELKSKLRANKDDYDHDLMGDDEDRIHLSGLTEIEREKILMERHAQREDRLRKKELLDKLNRKKGEEKYGVAVSFLLHLFVNLLEAFLLKPRLIAFFWILIFPQFLFPIFFPYFFLNQIRETTRRETDVRRVLAIVRATTQMRRTTTVMMTMVTTMARGRENLKEEVLTQTLRSLNLRRNRERS